MCFPGAVSVHMILFDLYNGPRREASSSLHVWGRWAGEVGWLANVSCFKKAGKSQ